MKKSILSLLVLVGVLNATCTNNGDNTVSCDKSGLMWQDDSDVGKVEKNWKEAIKYCEDLTLAGYNDWRLPNIAELNSITNKFNKISPRLKDGFRQRSNGSFWSSTTDSNKIEQAWHIFFGGGEVRSNHKMYKTYSIRCTR